MNLRGGPMEYCVGETDARLDEPKRAEMQDPGMDVLLEGSMKCTTESSVVNEVSLSEHNSFMESDSKLKFDSIYTHELSRPSCYNEGNKEHDQCNFRLSALGVDLSGLDTSSTVEHYPLYPFKIAGQVKYTDVSECGSTTGPVIESEPLRKWKEMKQNGFISPSPGGTTVPKQRGRPPRKKKDDDLRKKVNFTWRNQVHQTSKEQVKREKARREQVNRFTNIAAPSGLLSGLNPGIINHVRNSKQVHSIIEAIVRSERNNNQTQNRASNQSERGNNSRPTVGCRDETSEMTIVASKFDERASTSSLFTTRHEDDGLTSKLSLVTTLVSNDATSGTADPVLRNQDNFNSVTLKAATVASQWLELLQLDIKGRLAALRSSKKRLRNAMGTKLPYLTEFTSNQETNPSQDDNSSNAIYEMHVARWKALFNQMNRALSEEGKHLELLAFEKLARMVDYYIESFLLGMLCPDDFFSTVANIIAAFQIEESWLKQVKDMQLHCEDGLKYVLSDSLPLVGPSDSSSKTRKSEAPDLELAVQAAAASIYSTSNLIMRTKNVPSFYGHPRFCLTLLILLGSLCCIIGIVIVHLITWAIWRKFISRLPSFMFWFMLSLFLI